MTKLDLPPKEILEVYENLKLQEKSIQKQIADMREQVIAIVPEDKEIELQYGSIVRVPGRVTWTYSPALKTRIEEVDEAKKLEQQNGDATAKAGEPFVMYKEKKD